MQHREEWKPSKFIRRNGKLMASRDTREVALSSRLAADLVASCYDTYISDLARGKLLDLGCGKVPLFDVYRDFVTDSICVDWGNSPHKCAHLDVECDLTQKLPFSNNEFDTIILSDVLEHIPDPGRLWREMSRVLAQEGRVLMNVPFFYWLHEQPHDYYRYTEFALRRFAEMAGMKVIHLAPIGGAPEVIADIIAKNALRLRYVGRALAVATQKCASVFVNTRIGRRISASSGRQFPLGYFLVAQKSV